MMIDRQRLCVRGGGGGGGLLDNQQATEGPINSLSLSLSLLKRRCTYRPSVIYLIVNKLLSLSLAPSLGPAPPG
jgi:hypothetical protein